jgi:RNA-directed DNA polymerase
MELRINNLKWQSIHWKRAEIRLTKLQRKIYKLSAKGEKSRVHVYQDILLKSSSAKLIAVRIVTQDNRGKKTPGVDGIASIAASERLAMAKALRLDGKASPIRRVYIPKPGKDALRPLGIPTLRDRAKQALAKLALEPEWEAKFEPNSYGFRPGRNCHDAIEAIFKSINKSPNGKYVLDADIEKCFDTIDHDKLIAKLDTTPNIRRQIESWLKAGILNKGSLEPSVMGTPQGGVISPLLSNVALHGIEYHLKSWIGKQTVKDKHGRSLPESQKQSGLSVIRYADDFVVLHKDKEIIQRGQKVVAEWLLQNAGLKLSESKTKLSHTDMFIDGQVGLEFLGFSVRRYAMGKYTGNKYGTGMRTLIKPSRKSVKKHKLAI